MVALHGSLFRWGHKSTGEGRDIIGMLRGNRESSRGKTAVSVEGTEGATEGATEKGAAGQGGSDVFQFSIFC